MTSRSARRASATHSDPLASATRSAERHRRTASATRSAARRERAAVVTRPAERPGRTASETRSAVRPKGREYRKRVVKSLLNTSEATSHLARVYVVGALLLLTAGCAPGPRLLKPD